MRYGAQHKKVTALKTQCDAAIAELYYTDANGQRAPRFAVEVHNQKMAEIKQIYTDALKDMIADATERQERAAATLAKIDDPYTWLVLGDEDAKAASAWATFYREDYADMDAAGVLAAMEMASGKRHMHKWLAYRYGQRRLSELDAQIETAPTMTQRAQLAKVTAKIRDDLLLPQDKKAREDAQADMKDAKELAGAAEWAIPDNRRDIAQRWGVSEEHLPD